MQLSEILYHVIRLSYTLQKHRAQRPARVRSRATRPSSSRSRAAPPELRALRELLERLSPATLYTLLCIMHLGRGDLHADCLLAGYVRMSNRYRRPRWAVEELLAMGSLPQDLFEGMQELKAMGIDVDGLLGP